MPRDQVHQSPGLCFLSYGSTFFSGKPNGQHSQKQILDLILLHRELILIKKGEGAEQLESITDARS